MRAPRIKGELRYVLRPWAVRRRWMLFYVVAAVLLLCGAGYAAERYRTYSIPNGTVELEVPYVTYLVGEQITFTIKNNFDSAVYIPNECPDEPLRVYKMQDGIWRKITATTATENCTVKDRQIKVAARSSQSGNYQAWPELFKEPGKYRIVAYVDYYNIAPYQDFEIIAKPAKQKVYVRAPSPAQTSKPNRTTPTTNPSSSTPATTPAQPSASTLQSYSVTLSSGTVQVEYNSTTIYVRSITPAPGCDREGGRSGSTVEVKFECHDDETTLKLWLSNGKIQQKIES